MTASNSSVWAQWNRRLDAWNTTYHLYDKLIRIAQAAVVLCYVNQIGTSLEIWYRYNQPFPFWTLPMLPAALLVIFNIYPIPACGVLLTYATIESSMLTARQVLGFFSYGYLYINELMAKKFALLGAIGLIMAQHYNPKGDKPIMAGLLLSSEAGMSQRKSVLMLIGRLLLSSLFLYVGITEIFRQAESTADDGHGHAHRRRPDGDGHDYMWYKLLEFALGLPFLVGFKTDWAARLLAVVLMVEALTAWAWWSSALHVGYVLHAREHFAVNVAVAGGLLMLTHVGVGKYTVDEMLRKKDA